MNTINKNSQQFPLGIAEQPRWGVLGGIIAVLPPNASANSLRAQQIIQGSSSQRKLLKNSRKIIHIDMDCFYAAIEMRNNPRLRGKPLAVGGRANQRGVLCTCNYEARKYGIHSAMATHEALQRCPTLILLPVDMPRYKTASQEIRAILHKYTDLVEPLSLDEAYLDVSDNSQYHGSATLIAQAIKDNIQAQLQLTASAGVAPNKLLAKIASDWRKPNGLFVIKPAQVDNFMLTLPVKKILGVGKVTQQKLLKQTITTCAELQQLTKLELLQTMGKFGERLYEYCRGHDDRAVEPHRIRKSVSVERTFQTDLTNIAEANEIIKTLYAELQQRLQPHKDKPIKTVFVKIKFNNFQQTTVELTTNQLNIDQLLKLITEGYHRQKRPIRLLGLGVKFDTINNTPTQRQLVFDW